MTPAVGSGPRAERGRPLPCLPTALQSPEHAHPGHQVGRHILDDVQAGGGVEHDPGATQLLPVGQALQGGNLRALPRRGRVCASRPGSVRGRSGRSAHGLGGGGGAAATAEGAVAGRERRVRTGQQGRDRQGRHGEPAQHGPRAVRTCARRRPCPTAYGVAPGSTVPSSTVDARLRVSAQSFRSSRR